MRQRIFDLKLSVQATSLYLLLESLAGQAVVLERAVVEDLWNAGSGELDQAILELTRRGVINEQEGQWRINPPSDWA